MKTYTLTEKQMMDVKTLLDYAVNGGVSLSRNTCTKEALTILRSINPDTLVIHTLGDIHFK